MRTYQIVKFWNLLGLKIDHQLNFNTPIDEIGKKPGQNDKKKSALKRPILVLYINTLRKKLELLVDTVTDNVDILLISESKLDESFPMGQLKSKI